ncbi:MAG: hypothetical protein ABIT38_11305, partial [Gemmatimonadaceae bacterium]
LKRRTTLYVSGAAAPRFRCRACCRLGYFSQRLDRVALARRRLYVLAERMSGTTPNDLFDECAPARAWRMHRRTYRRVLHQWARVQYRYEFLAEHRLAKSVSAAGWLFARDPEARANCQLLAAHDVPSRVHTSPDAWTHAADVLRQSSYDA